MMFVFKDVRLKLKKQNVQNKDMMEISSSTAFSERRKRICRVLLGVKIGDRLLLEIANRDVGEQSYQILRKWVQSNGRSATYEALAQALLDRTVNLNQVVTDFCMAN